MSKNEIVEVDVDIVNVTEGAFLVSDGDNEGWVGRSLVANDDKNEFEAGDTVTLHIPQWKAEELGFV